MRICYFGTYDEEYSRNAIDLKGLRANGVAVVECHKNNFKASIGILDFLLNNLLLFTKGFFLFLKNKFDLLIIGYHGFYDFPSAYLLCKIFRKPLIYDALISEYDNRVVDRQNLAAQSIKAKLIYQYEKIIYKYSNIII